ncbi:MAG: ABC transporter ATP-binding protein/permease [Bacilli bacterium]|nr:ABC transporter ATP-binding protein/permease [Bacilli bacterium]
MLKITKISKSFRISKDRSMLALNDISYNFPSSGLFYIIGKSGSGKSTLLNIIAGLMKPDSGTVELDDKDIYKLKEKDKENYLKNDISIIFQKYNLIEDMTVYENLSVVLSIKQIDDKSRIDEYLKKYGLSDKKDRMVSSLSGGEKQRLALVRSLIGNPKVLLCDEPTGALDKDNSDSLIDDLVALSRDMLVIVVTHNMKYVKRFKTGYLKLDNGNLVGKRIPRKEEKVIERKPIKKKRNDKFIYQLARKNIKKNRGKNIISSISAGFSFLLLLLSTFFNSSISSSKINLINTYTDNSSFKVSEVSYEEITDSPLNLMKNKRPSYNDVYNLIDGKSFLINYSYDYFFNENVHLKYGSLDFTNFKCKPIYRSDLSSNEVIVNDAFYESYIRQNVSLPLNRSLSLTVQKEISYFSEISNKMIVDNFDRVVEIKVKEINEEFRYMNEPILYYPISFIEKIFKETEALNSTNDRGQPISFYTLIEESKNTDEIGDFSYYIFSLDEESKNYAYKLIEKFTEEDKIHLDNFGYSITTSFVALSKTIFLVINILSFIALLVSLFICGFLAYSSSLMNRKESAILSTLGASKNSIYQIYVFEQGAYSILGIMFGILFSLLGISIINYSVRKFFVTNAFIKSDPLTIIIFSLVMLIFEILVAFIPLKVIKSRKIYEELKEE